MKVRFPIHNCRSPAKQVQDALHQPRLLSVEERPFRRVTKRLLASDTVLPSALHAPPTPPPETTTDDDAASKEAASRREQFRTDLLLDFSAFESSIVRAQLLLNSHERERARAAAEQTRIRDASAGVRDTTTTLRARLGDAQATLARRKEYDALARDITQDRRLRPRAEQAAQLASLRGAIAELEREGAEYARTWAERSAQFGRIMTEAALLRRQIRDEKEEVERREGMAGDAADDAPSPRDRPSAAATPAGGATPMHPGPEPAGGVGTHLAVERARGLRGGSPAMSREASRTRDASRTSDMSEAATPRGDEVAMDGEHDEGADDVNMAEDGEVSGDEEVQMVETAGTAETARAEDVSSQRGGGEEPQGEGQMDTS